MPDDDRQYSHHTSALLHKCENPIGKPCHSIASPLTKFDGFLTKLTEKLTGLTVLHYINSSQNKLMYGPWKSITAFLLLGLF
jgi:hypothetical protein